MQLPIVNPAPLVEQHAPAFRHLFSDQRQYQHFQNYLTGLIVLENKSLANISRCSLQSADKSNLSRFLSSAPWNPSLVNDTRLDYLLCQTQAHRLSAAQSSFILDDTMCEHVGSLFEYIDRHYNHSDGTYPLAHNLVTSHYLSGAVRFPVDFELYRRYEDITEWTRFVKKYFPAQEIPKRSQARAKLHKQLDPMLLKDPEFVQRHNQFWSKIDLAARLVDRAIERGLPFSTVLIDSWYLSPTFIAHLQQHDQDWVSLLKTNRNLEACSIRLKNAAGQRIALTQPHIKVEDLVPLIPKTAFKPHQVGAHTYWAFTLCARIPGLGKVRLVISFETADLTGTYAVLVTNRTDWSAQQVLFKYLQRWPIETFYRDGKQHLGLDEYRVRTFEAIQTHWCLVFVAYSILHLAGLPPPPKTAQGKRPTVPSKTIGQVCRQQAQALVENLILFAHDCLEQGEAAAAVFSKLFAKQHKAVPASQNATA
jgi:SRSO17 transposase